MKKLLLPLLLAPSLAFSAVHPVFVEAMSGYQPLKISSEGSTITVVMNEARMTNTIYEFAASNLCSYQWQKSPDYLNGVQEIHLLNKHARQGYVFSNPKETCQSILDDDLPTKQANMRILGSTRMY
ncbi:hypothetical protein [Vibrio galatheae]|uniref:hypothetical protein n=1 Tax=Vibrio galatheae TaxID=579748 RepID=UPI0006985DB2|nr:hypothetical protein [Vibrio galatheae]